MEKHKERLPPRGLPVVYFLAGHVALLCATLAVATEPESFGVARRARSRSAI